MLPKFATSPPPNKLNCNSLPAGGWFTLQATLKNLDPAVASPSYNALFHDELRNKVWDVGTLTSATPTVETTLKVPDDPGNLPSLSEIRVTVLVRETGGSQERLVAASTFLGDTGDKQATPLSVTGYTLQKVPTVPRCRIPG